MLTSCFVQVLLSATSPLLLVFRANVRILQLSDIRVHIEADLRTGIIRGAAPTEAPCDASGTARRADQDNQAGVI